MDIIKKPRNCNYDYKGFGGKFFLQDTLTIKSLQYF